MGIADRYQKADTRSQFEVWLDSLTEKNRQVVLGWLRDPDVGHQRVADWIRDDDDEDGFVGYRATKATISGWRRVNGAR
jgi:hypothetical protein